MGNDARWVADKWTIERRKREVVGRDRIVDKTGHSLENPVTIQMKKSPYLQKQQISPFSFTKHQTRAQVKQIPEVEKRTNIW